MAEFRVRYITQNDPVSVMIRAVTYSMWSHAEIVLPDNTYLGAHASGGVMIRSADYCKPTRERRYTIPVTDEALATMLAFAHAQVGKPYDFKAIFGLALHQPWATADRWFCSELVTATADAGNLTMLNVQRDYVKLITPDMSHLSPLLTSSGGKCYYYG